MKKCFFILLCLFYTILTQAQQISPYQKQLLKQYGKDPANPPLTNQQKQWMKQMGISSNTDPKKAALTAKNANNTVKSQLNGQSVPVRDPKRIAKVNKKLLTYPQLTSFINDLNTAVEKRLTGIDPAMMNQFAKDVQSNDPDPNALANAASNAMILGDIDPAIWLMGKACQNNPKDANTLNNYAAFLLMCGAQEYAIPILNRLNADYPQNSTILNNLGQAWFGLGEIKTAKNYLDSAIIRFPGHSQATATESQIAENEGNIDYALKEEEESIQSGFSEAKANRIENLGGELSRKHFASESWLPEDPTWFSSILQKRPAGYYYSVSQRNEELPKWAEFFTACGQKQQEMMNKISSLGQAPPPKPPTHPNPNIIVVPSYICKKFQAKLKVLKKEHQDFEDRLGNASLPLTNKVLEKVNNVILESGSASKEKACQLVNQLEADLFEFQAQFEKNDHEFVKQGANLLAELIYTSKYAENKEKDYLFDQFAYQGEFLNLVMGFNPSYATAPFDLNFSAINAQLMWGGVPEVCPQPIPPKREIIPAELPDYDIISCKTKSTLGHKIIATITIECNVMTVEISGNYLPVHGKYKENWVKNQMIEVSGGVSVKAGGVGIGVDVGMDNKGNKSGSVSIGGKIGDVGVSATAGGNIDPNGNVTGNGGVSATVGIVSIGGTATVDNNGNISSQAQVGIKEGGVSAQGTINSNLDVGGKVSVSGSSNLISDVTGPAASKGGVNAGTTIELDNNGISNVTVTAGGSGSINLSGGDSNNTIGQQIGVSGTNTTTYVWSAGGNSSVSGTLSGMGMTGKW